MADFPTSRFQRAGVSAAAITDLQAAWALLSPAVQDAELAWISTLSDAEVAAITSFPASGGAVPAAQPPDGSVILVDEAGGVTVTAVAYAATITLTPSSSRTTIFDVGVLTGDASLAVSGSLTDGALIWLRLQQDGTGGRTVTYPAGTFDMGTDAPASSDPTGAGVRWNRLFAYNAGTSKLEAIAISRGF